jgi:class 3 adenylate cyclase
LGDTVNTAARLESMTKEKGVPILLTGASINQNYVFNGRMITLSPMGSADVRGKKESVDIYTAKFGN